MSESYVNGYLFERSDDISRTVTTYDSEGTVTEERPYNSEENADADSRNEQAARMDDLEARVAIIETHLWPPPETPTDTEGIPEFTGLWPAGGLIVDGGVVYRNVSGVPLTQKPSNFPGDPSMWSHLFVAVLGEVEPDPDPEPGDVPEWSPDSVQYAKDDPVTYNGDLYLCRQSHTSQVGWDPANAHSLWLKQE